MWHAGSKCSPELPSLEIGALSVTTPTDRAQSRWIHMHAVRPPGRAYCYEADTARTTHPKCCKKWQFFVYQEQCFASSSFGRCSETLAEAASEVSDDGR